MTIEDRLEQSLRSPAPLEQLRTLASDLLAHGQDRETVLRFFEDARERCRREGREADEDVILDLMDFLVGWCSPHMKL